MNDLALDLRFRLSPIVVGCRPFSTSRGPTAAHRVRCQGWPCQRRQSPSCRYARRASGRLPRIGRITPISRRSRVFRTSVTGSLPKPLPESLPGTHPRGARGIMASNLQPFPPNSSRPARLRTAEAGPTAGANRMQRLSVVKVRGKAALYCDGTRSLPSPAMPDRYNGGVGHHS